MKRRNTLIKIITVFTAFAIGGSLLSNHFVRYKELDATQHATNYADYEGYSGTYYNTIDFDATGGMNGDLRTSLTNLIRPKAFYTYSGTGANTLSTQLQYADADPTNSNNMVYLYTRDSVTKNAAVSWNREHVWPQSLSNENWHNNTGDQKAGTDILHLRPTYSTPNTVRSNNPYGDVTNGTEKSYEGMTYGWLGGGYFEPLDCVKGDVARIIMYVWTAYTDYPGYSALDIRDVFKDFNTLLTWHTQDKPDVLEGNRNNYAQSSNQKNRNPFVDHPELAWKIFSDAPNLSTSVKNACMEAYPAGEYVPPTPIDTPNNGDTGSFTVNITAKNTISYPDAPDSTNITFNETSNTSKQITSGNTQTLVVNLPDNYHLTGLSMSMKSNKSSGTGSLTINDNTIISDSKFNASSWYGNWSTEYVTITPNISSYLNNSNNNDNDFTIVISASVNSLYCESYTLSWVYDDGTGTTIVPTAVTLNKTSATLDIDDTVQLTASLLPSGATGDITWSSSNGQVASVTQTGLVRALAAGTAVITAKYSNTVKAECAITVNEPPVVIGDPLSEDINLNYTSLTGTGSKISDADALTKVGRNNAHIQSVALSYIYDGNGTSGAYENTAGFLKTGTSSAAGQIKFTLDGLANKVEILCHDFYKKSDSYPNNTNTFSVNGSDTQLAPYNTEATFDTLTFELDDASNVITIDINKRAFIKNIKISYVGSSVAPTIDSYLNNVSPVSFIGGTEENALTSEFDFTVQGYDNATVIPNVNIGSVSVTCDKGSATTSPTYYSSGNALRVYKKNALTFSLPNKIITRVVFTLDKEYLTASEGTLDGNVWNGRSSSVVFTNTGSDTTKISKIAVTYYEDTVSVNPVTLQFGISIPQADWEAITNEWPISDYGIKLFKKNPNKTYSDSPVEDAYLANKSLADIHKGSGVAPEADNNGLITFTGQVNVRDTTKYGVEFAAAAYIIADDQIYFIKEMTWSVNSLAAYYYTNGGSELTNAALYALM